MSRLITLIEDKKIRLNLSTNEMKDINHFKIFLGQQNVIVEYDGSVRIMHYVGFISKGNTRIQILPKIIDSSNQLTTDEISKSTGVLYKLLKESQFNRVLELKDPSQLNLENFDLLELFINLYAKKIIKLYTSKTNREYISIEENTAFVKGKIDFPKSIKQNGFRKDLHYVTYQSYEVDNILNNIIKTVAVQLLIFSKSSENRKLLKLALTYLDDAKELKLSYQLIESVKFTRLNKDFEPVFNMAKMFFRNQQPANIEGDESIFSFLVPVNALFEEYVNKLLKAIPNITTQYGKLNDFAFSETRNYLKIKPDYVLYRDDKIFLTADAKYKNPYTSLEGHLVINRNDIYQIFAYMKSYGTNKGLLLYPLFKQFDQQENEQLNIADFLTINKLKIIFVDLIDKSFDESKNLLSEELSRYI